MEGSCAGFLGGSAGVFSGVCFVSGSGSLSGSSAAFLGSSAWGLGSSASLSGSDESEGSFAPFCSWALIFA